MVTRDSRDLLVAISEFRFIRTHYFGLKLINTEILRLILPITIMLWFA